MLTNLCDFFYFLITTETSSSSSKFTENESFPEIPVFILLALPLTVTSYSVFSESSVQDYIKMQIEALPNHVYSFAIYIFDVYGNVSKPATFIVRT